MIDMKVWNQLFIFSKDVEQLFFVNYVENEG